MTNALVLQHNKIFDRILFSFCKYFSFSVCATLNCLHINYNQQKPTVTV